jgi:hypothetical protein
VCLLKAARQPVCFIPGIPVSAAASDHFSRWATTLVACACYFKALGACFPATIQVGHTSPLCSCPILCMRQCTPVCRASVLANRLSQVVHQIFASMSEASDAQMQDKCNVLSRSQELDGQLYHEEACSLNPIHIPTGCSDNGKSEAGMVHVLPRVPTASILAMCRRDVAPITQGGSQVQSPGLFTSALAGAQTLLASAANPVSNGSQMLSATPAQPALSGSQPLPTSSAPPAVSDLAALPPGVLLPGTTQSTRQSMGQRNTLDGDKCSIRPGSTRPSGSEGVLEIMYTANSRLFSDCSTYQPSTNGNMSAGSVADLQAADFLRAVCSCPETCC